MAPQSALKSQTPRWTFHGRTDVGRKRLLNEDAFGFDPGEGLVVVADGMGGHRGGAVASRVAVEGLMDALAREAVEGGADPTAALARAVGEANRAVLDAAREAPELSGMGCTLVAAWLRGGRVVVSHMGDSRAYLGRPDGTLLRLTRDHSYVEVLREEMGLTSDEARAHPMRNIVTRAVGTGERAQPDTAVHDLPPGSRLLLCSDGLWSLLEEEELERLLFSSDAPDAITRALVEAANEAGGDDNITAAVALRA